MLKVCNDFERNPELLAQFDEVVDCLSPENLRTGHRRRIGPAERCHRRDGACLHGHVG